MEMWTSEEVGTKNVRIVFSDGKINLKDKNTVLSFSSLKQFIIESVC